MVITAKHNRSDFTISYHLVELQSDVASAESILIKDTALGSDNQLILLSVADPYPVISILESSVRVDDVHSCVVGLHQILVLVGQAAPAERAIAIVEQHRSHDILNVGRINESFGGIVAVLCDVLVACIEDSLHEGVAVIEEVGSLGNQLLDQVEVLCKGLINQLAELLSVVGKELGSLFEGNACRAVTAVVRNVAGSLVGQKLDVLIVVNCILQKVYDVAVERDGHGLFLLHVLVCDGKCFLRALSNLADPALAVSGLDSGVVNLSNDTNTACDLDSLRLSTAHAAQTGSNEEVACKVALLRNAQVLTACIQDGVEGTVYDTLRSDVHPAACGHLTVAGASHSGELGPVSQVVSLADKKSVGDDNTRSLLVGVEESQRMAGHNNQCLLVGQYLKVLLDQLILHPVLAYLTGLTVGNQLVGIQSDLRAQVVVNHNLESFTLNAVAFIFINRLAVNLLLRHEAVSVDTASGKEFFHELRSQLLMKLFRNITKGILQCQLLLMVGKLKISHRCTAKVRIKLRILRKYGIQLNGHAFADFFVCHHRNHDPFS